jgi:hypothetical protein
LVSRLHAAAGALFPPKGEEKKCKVEAKRHARQAYQHAHHGLADDAEALSITALDLAAGSDFSERLIGVWRMLSGAAATGVGEVRSVS